MSDDEREAQIRKAHEDSNYYAMSPPNPVNQAFLLRRLNDARRHTEQIRAERNEAYAKFHEAEAEIVRLEALGTDGKVSELAIKLNEQYALVDQYRSICQQEVEAKIEAQRERDQISKRYGIAIDEFAREKGQWLEHRRGFGAEIARLELSESELSERVKEIAGLVAKDEGQNEPYLIGTDSNYTFTRSDRVNGETHFTCTRLPGFQYIAKPYDDVIQVLAALATFMHLWFNALAGKPDRTQQNAPDREAEGA